MTEKINVRKNPIRIDEGLRAEVHQVVTVSRGGQITVQVRITAYNCTKEEILLDEPYCIRVREAADVTAYDLVNKRRLAARHSLKKKRIEVGFSPNTVLLPNEKFSWRVSFKSMWLGNPQPNNDQNLLTGIFVIGPLESYKSVSIRNHRISLRIRFLRLNAKNLLRVAVVDTYTNNQNIPMQLGDGPNGADITFAPFDLQKGTKLRALFTYSYQSTAIDESDGLSWPSKTWGNYVQLALRAIPVIFPAISAFKELIHDLFRR